jgi:ELWxxDGT repeat protein
MRAHDIGSARWAGVVSILAAFALVLVFPVGGMADAVPAERLPTNFAPDPASLGMGLQRMDLGGTLYFVARDRARDYELWKSSGTGAGTVMVKDIRPGPRGSAPFQLTGVDGILYFTADDGVHGREVWRSDGTAAGTMMVKDVKPGPDRSYPRWLTNVGGSLFFVANGEQLWKSDGTAAGTVMVKALYPYPAGLTDVAGTLYFSADDGVHGVEPWKSNGTGAGTVMVKDVVPGSGDSSPRSFTGIDGTLYFVANGGIWKSDGTENGTVTVKALDPYPGGLTDVGGTLYFGAYDGIHGGELWKSDGTEAGTVMVKDISPGGEFGQSSWPSELTDVEGTLYFGASDGIHGDELWKSDGSEAGTVMVKDIRPGEDSSTPRYLADVAGVLFFAASTTTGPSGSSKYNLWTSDGTSDGTVVVLHGPEPGWLTDVRGTLYFSGWDRIHGDELWRSDGTAAGTVMVKDIWPGWVGSDPTQLTYVPRSADPRPVDVTHNLQLAGVGGILHFSADDGTHGYELWRSDGIEAGTVMIKDMWVGGRPSWPQELVYVPGWARPILAALARS